MPAHSTIDTTAHRPAPRPAQLGPVSDRLLRQIRNIAHDAARGDATRAEAELLLASVGPLLDELIAHRTLNAGIARLDAGGDNVIFLNH
jgi:hypothetical protein